MVVLIIDQNGVDALKRERPAALWSGNLLILSRCKSPEEREFYLRLARQLRGALFERAALGRPKVSPAVTQMHPDAQAIFKDSYFVDFLGLPEAHSDQEPQTAIIVNRARS